MKSATPWVSIVATSLARRACAATLASICTTAYVQSVLPADNFIQGITINSASVTANDVTNYTVASGATTPATSGLDFCNVTFTYSHTGLNGKVG
jgi:tannase